nr:subtilisin-like protease sbt1.8 [Quercus suber]
MMVEQVVSSSRVYHVTSCDADPTGKMDSTEAIRKAISDAVQAAIGIIISGQANTLTGVHCYNKATSYNNAVTDTRVLDQASNDIIIGVLDTGVWPESKSFDDSGLPEIPIWLKGECESGPNFKPTLCNKKLVSAAWSEAVGLTRLDTDTRD